MNTILAVAYELISNYRISIQQKDLAIDFELLENIYKVSVFTIDVLLNILHPRIDGYETKE